MRNQRHVFAILGWLVSTLLHAECTNTPRDKVLKADARHRPPEVVVSEKARASDLRVFSGLLPSNKRPLSSS